MKRILQIAVIATALAAASLTGTSTAAASDYITITSPNAPATVFQDSNGSWWYGAVRQSFGLYQRNSYYSYYYSHWLDCWTDNTFIDYGCSWR